MSYPPSQARRSCFWSCPKQASYTRLPRPSSNPSLRNRKAKTSFRHVSTHPTARHQSRHRVVRLSVVTLCQPPTLVATSPAVSPSVAVVACRRTTMTASMNPTHRLAVARSRALADGRVRVRAACLVATPSRVAVACLWVNRHTDTRANSRRPHPSLHRFLIHRLSNSRLRHPISHRRSPYSLVYRRITRSRTICTVLRRSLRSKPRGIRR